MLSPYIVVPDFFEQAKELRLCFDSHFGNPDHDGGTSHQIWDYWHVPRMYTYLRTDPWRVFPQGLMDSFVAYLKTWTTETLGLSQINPPYLSLYVNGCGQELHNDSGNGRWGFVYSLTKWDQRRFIGGETLIFNDTIYWETEALKRPAAGLAFYDLVPARFNQLLVFDDRLIHSVPHIQGNMAPQDGRVAIHGHIREGGVGVSGSLSRIDVEAVVSPPLSYIHSQLAALGHRCHGCVSLRLEIEPNGRVAKAVRLSDRVHRTSAEAGDPERLISDLTHFLAALRFPAAAGRSVVTVPVPIG